MSKKDLDPSTLKAFELAAAGHAGNLSSASGELFIKPCTKAEIDFYQKTLSCHEEFAEYMPAFMGTLQLGASEEVLIASKSATTDEHPAVKPGESSQSNTAAPKPIDTAKCKAEGISRLHLPVADDPEISVEDENVAAGVVKPATTKSVKIDECQSNEPKSDETKPTGPKSEESISAEQNQNFPHGKKLETEIAIVLENLEHGFRKPNVLDIKLGARLWADEASTDKRERFDKIAAETTSGSLNFRVTGMKVWNGNSYDFYDKYYGRKFTAENVHNSFETFFSGLDVSLPKDVVSALLWAVEEDIIRIKVYLEESSSRMYGTSILVIYEGDSESLNRCLESLKRDTDEEEEDDEALDSDPGADENPLPYTFRIRMIDFAHSAWTPGQGKDENVTKGLENIEHQLERLRARYR